MNSFPGLQKTPNINNSRIARIQGLAHARTFFIVSWLKTCANKECLQYNIEFFFVQCDIINCIINVFPPPPPPPPPD